MKKILFVLCFSFIAIQAQAQITCYDDGMGYRNCTGTDSYGEYVNINSYTDSLGYTETYGEVGNEPVNTHSYTDSLGYTETYGRLVTEM